MSGHDARPASDWPEHPYPGSWPEHSHVLDADAMVHQIEVDAKSPSGWVVVLATTRIDLDDWLRDAGMPGLSERDAVLSFGSNRCPSKVWRQGGPFVNLVCSTSGLAAVWSHGTRHDGQVVATLVGAEGHEANFFLSLCTADDKALLDKVEGAGYALVPVDPALVVLEDGTSPQEVSAYVGLHPHRWPVAGEDGHPVLLSSMTQDEAVAWRAQDPLHWEHVEGTPFHPLGTDD